jgi:D-alanyl-D-alanine carboxypeptidase (penicillin-binding protein 5/6)
VGLFAGDRYAVGNLFQALLMISANDAAVALADATGSYRKAIAMMNAEARHLRAADTVARTPNGLTASGQHSSAYDEALIARQALKIPEFMHDIGLHMATFPRGPHHVPVTLNAQNTMLTSYPGDLGGKIGWTSASETTFVGWARRGGHTLIVTIMHCIPLTEMYYAAQLLNWGFAMDGKVRPAGTLVAPLPSPPAGGPHRGDTGTEAATAADSAAVPLTLGVVLAVILAVAGPAVIAARRPEGQAGLTAGATPYRTWPRPRVPRPRVPRRAISSGRTLR